jgi:hypothetical protein
MKNTTVSYNAMTGAVDISIGMGGIGGPPPGGQAQPDKETPGKTETNKPAEPVKDSSPSQK